MMFEFLVCLIEVSFVDKQGKKFPCCAGTGAISSRMYKFV